MKYLALLLTLSSILPAAMSNPIPEPDHISTTDDAELARTTARQIYAFPDATFIENIHVRTDGHLLLTTFRDGNLLTLDPKAASPKPVPIASLPGSTGLTGIATIAPHLYAVTGGIHEIFLFANNSLSVYVVSVPADGVPGAQGTVVDQIPVPNTLMMNGLVSIPEKPHILLSADSVAGTIVRVNTKTRAVDVAFADPALGLGTGPGAKVVPLGINGIKIYRGYLYFTNSAQGTYGRVQINAEGDKSGPIEVITTVDGEISMTNAYDDFAIDSTGTAYVAVHSNSVQKVTSDGVKTTLAGGGDSTLLKDPTAAAMSADGTFFYLATGGSLINGVQHGGQIFGIKC